MTSFSMFGEEAGFIISIFFYNVEFCIMILRMVDFVNYISAYYMKHHECVA